jgi:uncharacterized membrane protein
MARTATKRNSAARTRKATGSSGKAARSSGRAARSSGKAARSTGNGASAAKRAAGKTADAVTPSSPVAKLAGAAAKKAFGAILRRTVDAGAGAIRTATERTGGVTRGAVESAMSKRLPIQVGVDVAVPIAFAWEEWMTFEWMTEGVHRIVDVERDGDELLGELSGPRSAEWVAEIVDERDEQSFAWRSIEGSDCAGLVTFHQLSDRLTRVELDLDVLPTNPAEAASLALRIGRRRAESELRRFKAHVEFISPDVYESDDAHEDEEPEEEPTEDEDLDDEDLDDEDLEDEDLDDEDLEDEDQ